MSTNIATYPITYQQTDIIPNNEDVFLFNNETIRQAVNLWFINQDECNEKYGPISKWNTSEVTNMSELFSLKRLSENGISYDYRVLEYIFASDDPKSFYISPVKKEKYNIPSFNDNLRDIAPNFELDLNNWDTSNVTDMKEMFYLQINLNPKLSGWKTSKVKNMSKMFYGATSFNQNLSKWDTSEVTDVSYMFFNAREFQNDPEIFTRFTIDMRTTTEFAFTNSGLFNEPYLQFLSYDGDLRDFKFTIKDKENTFPISPNNKFGSLMYSIKQKANNNDLSLEEFITLNIFIQSIYTEKEWIYNNVQLRRFVRSWIKSTPQIKEEIIQERGHISDWNISRVTSLERLFMDTKDFNEDISRWNTYKVTNMDFTFYQAIKFNQDIGSKVINEGQYNEYTAWDVSNVTTANCMFGYSAFNQDISNWNIQNIENKADLLLYAYNLEHVNVLFDNIHTLNRNEENNFISKNYLNNKTIRKALETWYNDPNHYIFTNPGNQANYYIGNISEWETELVTDMSYLFNYVSIPASSTNTTTTITNINNYFKNLPDIEGWNVMNVKNMNNLFYDLENNDNNRKKLIAICQRLFNLKYAHNLINNEYFKNIIISFPYSVSMNLFTELSNIGVEVEDNTEISIRRDRIFNERLQNIHTNYILYNYNEAHKERNIIYFYRNLATNIGNNFIYNLNNNNRITTEFHNREGSDLFSDDIDLGGFTKLLLFEPFVRFLYYDSTILDAPIDCEETRIENENKINFCPFMLDNGQLKINPRLKISPTTSMENPEDVTINTIFSSAEDFYSIVGVLLRKLITTPLRTPSLQDEYFKTYIPFGKILASLITGEIRLDDNSSFNETNNILNLIDHLEEIDKDFPEINDEHAGVNESYYLSDIDFEKKLPFTKIETLRLRNLAIRQRINYLKGSYAENVLDEYFPDANFAKRFLGESEKKLIICSYLCGSNIELFKRFQYFYDSMIKITQDQTRFYDIYENTIDEYQGHEVINLEQRVTSMNLMKEFYCDINTDRRKFLQFIDNKLNESDIQNNPIRSNRLRMFKELIEIEDDNYINDETLIKLFVWISGSICFPTATNIDFSAIYHTIQGEVDPRSFLFKAATCSNQLYIPIYDYSEGFEYTNFRGESFRGDAIAFPTDDAGNQRKYDYNKEKLRIALTFSLNDI